ncbi:ABC transporter permease [Salinithrix halophila]|uniref:ABC transporter permease n=1 Tax=Salinithrix halophila TaxID=1485204 RepID=A0ABV8JIK7_9BACL
MNSIQSLFAKRRKKTWAKGVRYAALIAKSLQAFPIFALLILYFCYKRFLEWLPADFPTGILLAVILTVVLTRSRYRTFVQPADPYFLFPAREELDVYFRKAFFYNLVLQLGHTFVWMLFLAPLFYTGIGGTAFFVFALILLLLLKSWNLYMLRLEITGGSPSLSSLWLRGGTNLLILLWLFEGRLHPLLIPAALLWLGLITWHKLHRQPPSSLIPWERLIAQEEQTVSAYYRLASQFVEVPHIRNEVRPRRWLAFLEGAVSSRPDNTYLYLYLRTFLRHSEPFGATLRLTLVAAILLLTFRPSLPTGIIILAVALFVTGIQLPWIRRIHRFQPWFRLYPLPEGQKQRDLSRLVFRIIGVQSTLILLPQPLFWYAPSTWGLPLLFLGWGAGWLLGWGWIPRQKKKSLA